MFWSSFYGVTAARLAGVPVIVTSEHGKNLWKKRPHKLIEKYLISAFADIRLCVSTDIFNIRKNNDGVPENKLKVLPNSTYLPALNKKRPQQKVALGAIGRLIDAKDYPTLIQAAAILRRDKIKFILYIIGDGPLYSQLANMVDRYELNEYVKLTGWQSDVAYWLQKLDVFVMSSVREGQPLALLEAMAYELPVVATRVGGIPETITDGVEGLLVPSGCSKSMAAALKRVIQSNALRTKMGVKSREKVEKEYSIETNCSKLLNIYRSILARKIKY
jgi:glycosyltransferase involved in cell wall biosynthesis